MDHAEKPLASWSRDAKLDGRTVRESVKSEAHHQRDSSQGEQLSLFERA